jgi:hypothetical protein
MRYTYFLLLLLALSRPAAAQDKIKCPNPPQTRMVINEGTYVQGTGVEYKLKGFVADLVPRGKAMPACLAKMTNIRQGDVVVSTDSLSRMFARKMSEGGKDSSIQDLSISTEEGQIVIKGKAKKLIPISFVLKGPVDVVDGSKLRFHSKDVKAAGLPAKTLMKMLGVHMGEMINDAGANGVSATDEYIIFDPKLLAHVEGKIEKLQILDKALYVEFASAQEKKQARR